MNYKFTIMEILDILIVGGGPSGILCGLEASERGLSHVVIERGVLVNSLYNFPDRMTFYSTAEKLEIGGLPFLSHNPRPTRDESLEYYRRVVKDFNLNIHTHETVLNISKSGNIFTTETNKMTYQSYAVVVANGYYSMPSKLNIPGEALPKVSHYYKNAHPYIGKEVLIVGAANSACDAALECWQKGAKVTMVVRGDSINHRVKYWIKPNIENRIKEGSIKAYFNAELTSIELDDVKILWEGKEVILKNDFVLALTGYRPDYDFLTKIGVRIEEDEFKLPFCDAENLETNIPGLYLAGVVNCGLETHRLFIENTREHGRIIVDHYLKHRK